MSAAVSPSEEIVARIERDGPLPFSEVMETALYGANGFFETSAGAGRAGADFVTSSEVGLLFGAVVARALDSWWDELGRPEPFTVIEMGAGRGTLARAVIAAGPRCAVSMRYVAVERSAALRAQHPERVESVRTLPDRPVVGVVLANELLDNLPLDLLERTGDGWRELRVAVSSGALVFEGVPVSTELAAAAQRLDADAPEGACVPVQTGAGRWLAAARACLEQGVVVTFDYGDTTRSMAGRPREEWLRTYRRHQRGGDPLADLGSQDITCEVAFDQLAVVAEPAVEVPQAEWLRSHGLDDLVDEGRRRWAERAHIGDLEAIKARSRVSEAEALTDPAGLGAFHVLEWHVP